MQTCRTLLLLLTLSGNALAESQFEQIRDGIRSGTDQLAALQRYVREQPDHQLARLWLVRELVRAMQPRQALALLTPLRTPRTDDWQVWFWSASAHLQLGQFEQAQSDLDRALSTGADVAAVWVQQAVLEQARDNHAGAVQLLQIAAAVDADDPLVRLNLAYSYERLGEPALALGAYQSFLAAAPGAAMQLRPMVMRRISLLAGLVSQADRVPG